MATNITVSLMIPLEGFLLRWYRRIFATGIPPSSFDNCTTVVPGLFFWLLLPTNKERCTVLALQYGPVAKILQNPVVLHTEVFIHGGHTGPLYYYLIIQTLRSQGHNFFSPRPAF
jgi:hypothetical protein